MKKVLSILMLFVLIFTLAACDDGTIKVEEPVVLTDAEKVLAAKDALDLGTIDALTENIILPALGLHDVLITWESNNVTYISNDGIVVRPLFEDGNKYAQLTATLTLGEISVQKAFNAMVVSQEEIIIPNTDDVDIISDKNDLLADLDLNVTDHLTLQARGTLGSYITWTTSDERLINLRGHINRPGFNEGDAAVTLTATLVKGEYTETKVFNINLVKEDNNVVTSTVVTPFVNDSSEYIVNNTQTNLYFMNNGNLPYVDIQEFITSLDGAIVDEELLVVGTGDQLSVSYVVEGDEGEDDYTYEMAFDFTENTVSINDFEFFDGFGEELQTDYGGGIAVVDYVFTDPAAVNIDFDEYDFDLVVSGEMYLMPLHLANLFYSGYGYNVYYNGDVIYGADVYKEGPAQSSGMAFNSSITDTDIPEDIREASYDYLVFVFDYFYGLKADQEVETYYEEFAQYYNTFVYSDTKSVYKALFRSIYSRDDLHSYHEYSGYYGDNNEIGLSLSDLGPNSQEYYETYWDIEDACDNKQAYRTLDSGTIGVIFIEGFDEDTPTEFEESLEALMALGTVESVVIDISCNGGGIIGTMIQILGFLTDEPIGIHSKNVSSGATSSAYYSTENLAVDVDWFILTTKVTFSAANLMANVAQDMNLATIIGQQTGGGACSVSTIIDPAGSVFSISSTFMLTNSRYESTEAGIIVDVYMEDVNDDQDLVGVVNRN